MVVFSFLKSVIEHKKNEGLSREALRSYQLRKFRKLVGFAKENSPYYSNVIKSHGISADTCTPEDFPILTKNEVIKCFDEIVTDKRITRDRISEFLSNSSEPSALFDNNFYVVHTSGSSGVIGYFVYSKEEWAHSFSHFNKLGKLGLRKRAAYIAATQGHFAGVSLAKYATVSINKLFYSEMRTFDINQPIEKTISGLNEFQPHLLSGYATVLKILARAKEKGHLCIKPLRLHSGGEAFLARDHAYVEEVFDAPVVNVYASSEHLVMGIGKPGFEGMYLMEDDLIFEFHDDHICVTNLFNYTMPLIRYRMEDVLVPQPDIDDVTPFTKIKDIIGRNEYTPIFTNRDGADDFIHPFIFVEFYVNNLTSFQIELLDKSSFVFYICLEDGLSQAQKSDTIEEINQKLGNLLSEKNMENVSFRIQEVDTLKIDENSGKFRLILKSS